MFECKYCGVPYPRYLPRGITGMTLANHYLVCPERRAIMDAKRRKELGL